MNIILREIKANRKQTIYWMIGLLCLLFISFYKVQGLSNSDGGMDAVMKSLPPVLQAFFGSTTNAGTGIGAYQMIHLYMCIALALHAVLLGANIFSKEEHDKTFEFLYVKGVTRTRILYYKAIASMGILISLVLISFIGVYCSVFVVGYTLSFGDIFPYIASLFVLQLFFFYIALAISLLLRNNQKAGMMGCLIVFAMFMITMYVKIGGSLDVIDQLSLFHYVDTSYIQDSSIFVPYSLILVICMIMFILSQYMHNRRDLLN